MLLTKKILDNILNKAADEVFILNPNGSVCYVNQSTLERRNFSREEMMAMSVWDWNTFVTEESWRRRWNSLVEIKRARFETRHEDKSGSSFPVDVQAHYLCIEGEEYCICFVNDISELAEKVYELGQKHQELVEAKRRADEALKSLQDLETQRSLFFATVAHELRTPISAISMLCSDDSADSWAEARVHIQSLSRDLLHTLDDMRRLTRDKYQREITNELFTMHQLSESLKLLTSAYITNYQMGLEFSVSEKVDSSIVEFNGDLYRLKTVLANLVKNACLHSGGNNIRMDVSVQPLHDNNYELIFRVSDNGKGIPAEQIETLFSPYSRGETDSDGSGLGLHIARSWIQELGGDLRNIPSEFGAVFEVSIKLKGSETPLNESGVVNARDKFDSTSDDLSADEVAQLSVLFVEDDLMIQMVGQKLLSKMFAKVEVASDGLQALEKLNDSVFDVILTDYFMPNMNGLDLIRQLRSSGYDGVIYACSAATLGGELNQLSEAGANDVISKPMSLNKLMACIANDAEIFRACPNLSKQVEDSMKKSDKSINEIIQINDDRAMLLIDLENGEMHGTQSWRKLNAVEPHQTLSRTLLNQTIPEESRDAFVNYSKQFFQSPVEAPEVTLEITLQALNGRKFSGRITTYKMVVTGSVLACTEVVEI